MNDAVKSTPKAVGSWVLDGAILQALKVNSTAVEVKGLVAYADSRGDVEPTYTQKDFMAECMHSERGGIGIWRNTTKSDPRRSGQRPVLELTFDDFALFADLSDVRLRGVVDLPPTVLADKLSRVFSKRLLANVKENAGHHLFESHVLDTAWRSVGFGGNAATKLNLLHDALLAHGLTKVVARAKTNPDDEIKRRAAISALLLHTERLLSKSKLSWKTLNTQYPLMVAQIRQARLLSDFYVEQEKVKRKDGKVRTNIDEALTVLLASDRRGTSNLRQRFYLDVIPKDLLPLPTKGPNWVVESVKACVDATKGSATLTDPAKRVLPDENVTAPTESELIGKSRLPTFQMDEATRKMPDGMLMKQLLLTEKDFRNFGSTVDAILEDGINQKSWLLDAFVLTAFALDAAFFEHDSLTAYVATRKIFKDSLLVNTHLGQARVTLLKRYSGREQELDVLFELGGIATRRTPTIVPSDKLAEALANANRARPYADSPMTQGIALQIPEELNITKTMLTNILSRFPAELDDGEYGELLDEMDRVLCPSGSRHCGADKVYHDVVVHVNDLRMLSQFTSSPAENLVNSTREMLREDQCSEARRRATAPFPPPREHTSITHHTSHAFVHERSQA